MTEQSNAPVAGANGETPPTLTRRVVMKRDLLRHLVRVMESVRDRGLPLNMWGWIQESAEHACGMVCCAGGWAALDPAFNALGLTAVVRDSRPGHGLSGVTFKGMSAFAALEEFFGLTSAQTEFLFAPHRYCDAEGFVRSDVTPDDVIARVRHLLNGGNLNPKLAA